MLLVGLTGGIGAGKSAFAKMLRKRGAHVIDADLLGREALGPGEAAWRSAVTQFTEEILLPGSMEVDRKKLADIVFHDPGKLAALNAIVHPVIMKRIAEDLERLQKSNEIVVIDAALLVETRLAEIADVLVVVVAEDSVRCERLARERGMPEEEVKARIAAQAPTDELVSRADIVVKNNGTFEELTSEADRVWEELLATQGKRQR